VTLLIEALKFFPISRTPSARAPQLPGEPTHPTPHHRNLLHHHQLCSAATLSGAAADTTGGGAVREPSSWAGGVQRLGSAHTGTGAALGGGFRRRPGEGGGRRVLGSHKFRRRRGKFPEFFKF